MTGETEAERLAGAEAVLTALRTLLHSGAGKGRGGRRRVYDRSWAESQLIAMAADVDGLPECQAVLIERLQLRFQTAGKLVPGLTWSKKIVSDFVGRSQIQTIEAREKYARSVELQSAFASSDDYVAFASWRLRLEDKWLYDNDLQRQYPTPVDYVADMIPRTPWQKCGSGGRSFSPAEFATIRG